MLSRYRNTPASRMVRTSWRHDPSPIGPNPMGAPSVVGTTDWLFAYPPTTGWIHEDELPRQWRMAADHGGHRALPLDSSSHRWQSASVRGKRPAGMPLRVHRGSGVLSSRAVFRAHSGRLGRLVRFAWILLRRLTDSRVRSRASSARSSHRQACTRGGVEPGNRPHTASGRWASVPPPLATRTSGTLLSAPRDD
mgnify:CR=1 FL=1